MNGVTKFDNLTDHALSIIIANASAIHIDAMLVCKRWYNIITNMLPEVIQKAVMPLLCEQTTSLIPSCLYEKLTAYQQVELQNTLARVRGVIYLKDYKYRKHSWAATLNIICGDNLPTHYVDFLSSSRAYFRYMFDKYEQYRYYIVTFYEVQYDKRGSAATIIRQNKMPVKPYVKKILHHDLYELCKGCIGFTRSIENDLARLPADLFAAIKKEYMDYLFEGEQVYVLPLLNTLV